MTNEQIIFNERYNLMQAGVIGTTGRLYVIDNGDGSKTTVPEPEEIHTFGAWKERGFVVMKGEKAVTKLTIWKYVTHEKDDGTSEEKMYLKTAHFFSRSQVQELKSA